MPDLVLEGVTKSYGAQAAVRDLCLHVCAGELLVLMGPSGCGKSTTLRLVSGLESPDAGDIRIDGRALGDQRPSRRGVSLVMQGENLFPHLRVRDNLLFGPRLRGVDKQRQEAQLLALATELRIEGWLDRFPGELSGGERQLVSIGRAMMHPAHVVLLDEPLAHLDGVARRVLRTRLRRFQRKHGTTMVHVTHDQAEAMALADRIAIMRRGSLVQVGSPDELYRQPQHAFVAEWLGDPPMNVFQVEWQDGRLRGGAWETSLDLPLPSGPYWAGIRPEQLRFQDSAGPLAWQAQVEGLEHRGDRTIVQCESPVGPLQVLVPGVCRMREGDAVTVTGQPEELCLFARATGERVHPPLRA
jgi:ABC-type sugar transport system ATPase subunit